MLTAAVHIYGTGEGDVGGIIGGDYRLCALFLDECFEGCEVFETGPAVIHINVLVIFISTGFI